MAMVTICIPIRSLGDQTFRGLESLMAQTFRDVTFVCMADDNLIGAEGLRTYVARDSRFLVIGAGLPERGEIDDAVRRPGDPITIHADHEWKKSAYVGYLNQGDLLEPEVLERMFDQAEGAQLDVCACKSVPKNTQRSSSLHKRHLNRVFMRGTQAWRATIKAQVREGSLFLLYNRSFLKEHGIEANSSQETALKAWLAMDKGFVLGDNQINRASEPERLTPEACQSVIAWVEDQTGDYAMDIKRITKILPSKPEPSPAQDVPTMAPSPIRVDRSGELVSVIVPIYNVGDYLEQCLDSILAQTHQAIEVICVNDGSTDDSLAIMRRYEAADSRVTVIDKPNAGYGNSVNRGLEVATGDWISIIEPDDFIDPHMYSGLLSCATSANGGAVDIVKGTYWLYFDLGDGTEPYTRIPNITNEMPAKRIEFTVYDDCEVMKHHPCIWSALYRHDFLEEFGIRMTEPPGAGWADNPWFFQTMLQARSIVWVPASYYYYRQTNPNASSVLRAYQMPFERLRDIRGIFNDLNVTDRNLTLALYQRSFNYIIYSIFDEFGFDESDPGLQALIREVLESMDRKLLLEPSNKMPVRFKDYYTDFMGIDLDRVRNHPASDNPTISFVLPMKDDREGLWITIKSLLKQDFEDFEVLCYDCDARDRSAQIIQGIAQKDERFKLMPTEANTVAEGFNQGFADAQGEWIWPLRSGAMPVDSDAVSAAVAAASQSDENMVLLGWREQGEDQPEVREAPRSIVVADGPQDAVIAGSLPAYTKLFRTSWLRAQELGVNSEMDDEGIAFSLRALLLAKSALLVPNVPVIAGKHDDLARRRFEDEDEIIAYEEARINVIADVARSMDTKDAWKATRETLLQRLDSALAYLGRFHASEAYFKMLERTYRDPGLSLAISAVDLEGGYTPHPQLDLAFNNTYDDYVAIEYQQVVKERDAAKRTAYLIRNSGSYKAVRSISKAAKSIIPSGLQPAWVQN